MKTKKMRIMKMKITVKNKEKNKIKNKKPN